MLNRLLLASAAVLVCIALLPGCLFDDSRIAGPSEASDETRTTDSSDAIATVKEGYPSYSFCLNVPFLKQVPPGDWGHTKNCGQACGAMLGGYFNHGTVAAWVIDEENHFLAGRFNDSRYNSPNGWYTNFNGRNELGTLLCDFHAVRYQVRGGGHPDDVIHEVSHGRPVICGVMIKDGRLVSSGGVAHWVLAVGWNGRVILHDPGTSSGRYIQYSVSAFEASWATQGKIYVATFK